MSRLVSVVVPGLTTVIVPCLGPLAAMRRCLAAVCRHTRPDWELIAVTREGGPDTEVGAYLLGLGDAASRRVATLSVAAGTGYRACCHRGLKAARGEFVALVHPATEVTEGWLDQLLGLLRSQPRTGVVGPMSNGAPPPQRAEVAWTTAGPGTGRGGEDEAARWRATHRGQWRTTADLWGGCLVARRCVLEAGRPVRAAGLRRRRLAQRVRRAGYELAVAYDLYVHHHAPERAGARRSGPVLTVVGDPAGPPPRRLRVSLTMIVRDEERNLPACLGSAQGVFDEVVVVDTGSTDRTVEIATSFGAVVGQFAWCDDFAAARNAALERATGDYVFWLDADDVLDPAERSKLIALLDGLDDRDAAYVVRCSCDGGPEGGGATVVDHVRLFPRRAGVRWEYRVHEQVLPSLRRAGVEVRWTDVVVRHTGYVDPATRDRKLERDTRILLGALAEAPDDPFVLFNLGFIAVERDDPTAALAYLTRSLAGSAATDSITRKLYALMARAHQKRGDLAAALAACGAGLAIDPEDAELWFRRAVLHRHRGEAGEAASCWRHVLTLRRPERFSSVEEGIYGHLTRRNLAALAEERRDPTDAIAQWRAVLAECPGDRAAVTALQRLGAP